MAAEAWQDFGQKVDLTARIREILLNYPEGTSILKELVQNADDARATCIKFCLDCRQHGRASLLSPAMSPFQGPALLAFNDGVFSDRDLESISRIGDSKKKEEEGKTGRFGVGFNSCYHLTDLPSFVSGRHLVIFDPHCRHLPNISSTNPGKRIDFVQHGDVAAQYGDQVAPYTGAFGCTLGAGASSEGGGGGGGRPWEGTLFRFPLRSSELAEASTISKQVYTIESIRSLLDQLATESFQILLFLKHIARLEVHEWPADAGSPHLLFSCHVSNLSREVAWERGLFARVSADRPSQLAAAAAAAAAALPEVLSSYRLELRREWHGAADGTAVQQRRRRSERRSYIVSQMRGGGEVADLAEQLSRVFGAVVAWGAVAADVTTTASGGGGGGGGGAGEEAEAAGPPEDGRAFCFLPLPIRTGLPVHVNGYFELSSNRRDIWYGEDMTGSGARRAHWNMQLLLRVIAPAYAAALTAAAATLGHGEAYDRLWPARDVAEPWQSLLVALFRRLSDSPVCWSTVRGGCWVAPRAGVLRDQAAAAAAASPALAAALVQVAGLPLLESPPGVGELMLRHMEENKPRVCSPALARQALLAVPAPTPAGEPSADSALRSHAPALLDYCLSDLLPSVTSSSSSSSSSSASSTAVSGPGAGAQHAAHAAAAQLVGLRLLPLLDGTTATLQAATGARHPHQPHHHPHHQQQHHHQQRGSPAASFFLPTAEECTLLARAGGLLVDVSGLSPAGRSKLTALATARLLNVTHLDAPAMAAAVLPRLLPPEWLAPGRTAGGGGAAGGRVVSWEADAAAAAAGVDRDWLQLLWRWLATHEPLSCFLGLPLLPILGGRLAPLADAASCTAILPPSPEGPRQASAAAAEGGGGGGGGAAAAAAADPAAQLSELLTQLGLQILDLVSFSELPVGDLIRGSHVHRCDGPGILAALQRLSAATQQHPQAGRATGSAAAAAAGSADGADEGAARGGRSVLSAGLTARVAALAAADKRLLRSGLLTEECLTALAAAAAGQFRGGGGGAAGRPPPSQAEARALVQLLAALPIYESARGAAAGGGGAMAAAAAAAEPRFMSLYGSGTCFLAPAGVDVRVLGAVSSGFVVATSEAEGRLMVSYLGVRAVTAAETYRSHVLPALASLPAELRNAAVLGVLRGLPQLSSQDRGFGAWLAQVPFVPNNKGELHTPGELYDPRNPDLAALLDPEADFPAASLLLEAAGAPTSAAATAAAAAAAGNGATPAEGLSGAVEASGGAAAPPPDGAARRRSSSEGGGGAGDASLVLYMLQQLGLRTTASFDTLLRAARFVERVADAAAAAAATPGASGSAAAEDADMAVARGKALLAYLEAEAGRIMGPVGATSAATAAAAGALAAGGGASSGAAAGPSGGGGGGGGSGGGSGARKFAAGLFSRARELFGSGGPEQPALAEVHNFWQELARVRWCPVLQEPPAPGLPWPPRHAVPRLAAPRTVRPPADMWLCSGCLFLVEGECRSSALAAGLGWSGPLGGSVLAQQLLQLGELHARVTDAGLSQVLAGVVPLLYRSLAALGLHEGPVARGLLAGSRCVWVGNGFAPAGKVAFKGSLDLSPWLYVMPAELAPFKDLLLSYGAADGFSAVQYCSVLQDMAEATGVAAAAQPSGSAAADGSRPPPPPAALTEVQLGQVVAVAQALADLSLPPGATIYLPDERGVLARAGDLAFNDAPWLAGQPSSASVRLVHPRISAHVAARLGTPSLRRLLLAASADSMALGTVGGAEAFGQSEALTTRLRHIIGDYPEGPGVLMELLQNADDAGATSLELMLDDTTYPAASILSPAMAVWQGPALLVANDAVFSPSDFANISRIGQDSKASRPTSIGRFGLGFNAVYHFTDLPCFVSGDYLVMFDPHAKYLPGVSAAQPGLKIAFARAQLLQQFPDAFTPFTHLGCNMRERFMGTLFRFPLRGPAAAAASDIKTSPCSPADVAALLESFRRQLPAALLFLKNIRTVSAYHRSAPPSAAEPPGDAATAAAAASSGGEGPSVRLLFRASPEMADPAAAAAAGGGTAGEGGPTGGLLQSAISRFIAGSPSDPTDLPTFYKRLASTQPAALPSQMGLMRLHMQTDPAPPPGGGGADGEPAAAVAAAGAAEPGAGNAIVADAAAPGAALVSERWLVCNALGGGGARELALKSFRNHGTKMVPWVGVAARLAPEAADADDAAMVAAAAVKGGNGADGGLDGRAFCFLPLPIRTGLPVHVNGYFELSSNRRDIWYGGDMSGAGAARSCWNVALMSDALAPCYGRVLAAVAQQAGPGEQLYRLLPSLDTPKPWSHLVSALYEHHLGELPIVWTRAGGGRWISPRSALFSDAACAAEPLLRNLLVALGLPLACSMPPAAEASLLRGVPGATAVAPHHVRRHLAQMLRAAGGDGAMVSQQIGTAAAAAVAAAAAAAADSPKGQLLPQPLPAEEEGGVEAKLTPLTAAVAALLRYCLSDLDAAAAAAVGQQTAHSQHHQQHQQQQHQHQHQQQQQQQQQQQALQRLQQELDGLPLLPLADGTVGRLQALPPASAAGSRSARGRHLVMPASVHVYVLTRGSLELELLAGLRGRCLAPALPGALVELLQQVVDLRLFNLQRLSPALLDSTLLPLLLPPSWQGAAEVEWAHQQQQQQQQQQDQLPAPSAQESRSNIATTTAAVTAPSTPQTQQQQPDQQQSQSQLQSQPPPQQQSTTAAAAQQLQQQQAQSQQRGEGEEEEPSADWIRALWTWLAERGDGDVLQLASWPVLPIQGGRLGRLQEKSLVLREGDWTEAVSSALLCLGCRLLDTTLLQLQRQGPAAGLEHRAAAAATTTAAAAAVLASPALQACVQQPSLTGLLAAIAAAKARTDSNQAPPSAAAATGQHPHGAGLGLALAGGGDRRPGPWVPPTAAQLTNNSGAGSGAAGAYGGGSGGVSSSWSSRLCGLSVVERRQLRSYLLQSRWFSGSSPPLTAEGLELLRSLPVFEVFPDPDPQEPASDPKAPKPTTTSNTTTTGVDGAHQQQQQQHQQQALRHFTGLDPQRHRLAPPDTDPRVLSSAFLRADSPAEEALLERSLGVARLSAAELLEQHVGPRAGQLPREALAGHVAALLGRLGEAGAGAEVQRLRQALSEQPIIPTASPSGELRRPSELHDPRVGALTSLLPPASAFFPAPSLTALLPTSASATSASAAASAAAYVFGTPAAPPPPRSLLDSLVVLGMARTVDLRVMLTAANALQADHAGWAATAAPPPPPPSAAATAVTEESLLARARALLKQLELWAAQYGSSGGGPGREEDPKRAWAQLAGLSWCPVLREAPEPGLPWPSAPPPLLAPPRLVRPPADAWLVGATLHILERPVGPPLLTALGWDVTPRVSVLAAQLIELGRLHALKPKRLPPPPPPPPPAEQAGGEAAGSDSEAAGAVEAAKPAVDGGESDGESAVVKAIDAAVHRLYGALSAAVDGPEGDLVVMSFERPDAPCVWVGAGFVLPGAAVLRSEGDFRPYLWVVPEPLHQYARLLSVMGVMDRFTAQHFAAGLASLAAAAAGAPLDDDSLALALQLADCAADALSGYGGGGRPAGRFFVPDASGVLTPAPELFFNDAEWLDARDVQMAHGALPQTTAEALGVRSLRYAHEVEAQLTAALPCPSPEELRERLGLAGQVEATSAAAAAAAAAAGVAAASAFLFELLEVADALGLRSMRLVVDARQHPAQSLLQPALAEFQGPALCAVLPDVALSAEELAALLCSRAQPPSVRGRVTAYSLGLQSAFLVSELLQVVSGNSTYMFDPSGAYLGSGGGGSAAAAAGSGAGGGARARSGGGGGPSPRAKQYVHASSDLLSTFADQFSVWSFADGYDIRSHVSATLLRLPLRRAAPQPPGAAAAAAAAARARGGGGGGAGGGRGLRGGGLAVATLESVEAALRQFAVHGPRSLLFLHCLTGIEVSLLRPSSGAAAPAAAAGGRPPGGVAPSASLRRELLLQATVVALDPDRPRPDFGGAGAAARQRSGGPGALKALAQAFGRTLGRGGGQDGPKQHLCPLELHVMAHNGLLLAAAEPEESPSQPPPPPASSSTASGSGGGAAAAGLGLGLLPGGDGDDAQGSTLYRERWLVSSCHDLEGVPLPAAAAAAAAAGGGGGRPELVAAAAVCIARDDQRNLFPASGLFAPVYLPQPPAAAPPGAAAGATAAATAGGAALGRMPFLVAGHFYLSRRNGKHIVPPFARADGGAVAAGGGAGGGAAAVSAAPPQPLLPQLQHRCEHNRRVLDLAATAWQNLALYFCSQDSYNGPRDRLYDIFPDIAAATAAPTTGGGAAAAGAAGAVDEAALYCVRQMYAAASRLALWRLRTGRFVHLPEGCFLQPTTEGLGPAAMGFMARQLPLFDVPWVTKQHLEAADVHGLRTVSPAVVRPLLKNLGRRQGGAAGAAGAGGGGKLTWPGLTVLEATELLQFCSADLVAEAAPAASTAPPPDAARGAGRGQAAAAPAGGGGGPVAGAGGPAGGVGGLLDGLTSQMRNVVGELVGPALYDQLRQQALGMLGDAAAAAQQPAVAAAAAAAAAAAVSAPSPAPPLPRYHAARLLECRGLPIPTAAGSIEVLGTPPLMVAPPLAALPSPAALLPPQCALEFVHPDCVARLADHFKDPQFRSSLEVRLYTLDDVARHMRTALPPGWDHPMAPPPPPAAGALQRREQRREQQRREQQRQQQRRQLGDGPTDLGRVWDSGGDGPSGLWLWQLWALVNGLLDSAREWLAGGVAAGGSGGGGSGEARLDPLHNWPLLPVLGSGTGSGFLLPVRHCRLVVCLPQPSPPEQQQQQPGGKAAAAAAGAAAAAAAGASEEGPGMAAGPVPALRDLVPSLPPPWSWLAPALHSIGCPLMDPRFSSATARHCAPHPDGLPARRREEAAAVAGSAPTRGSVTAAAGAAVAALVEKLRLCDAASGGALPFRVAAEWDDVTRAAVLGLLAEATPGTIDPADILFLRRLPIYPTHAGDYTALEDNDYQEEHDDEEEEEGDEDGRKNAAGRPALALPPIPTWASIRAAAAARQAAAGGAAATAAAGASAAASSSAAAAAASLATPMVCSAELLQLVPGLAAALPACVPRLLLLPQPGASRLYTLLGVASLSPPAFLGRVLLRRMGELPEGVRALLLTHVQSNWPRLRSEDSLLSALRDTPFVPAADGSLKRPSELYDPDQPLFAAAFLGCPVFPRDHFAGPAWLPLLRDVGLQYKVTAAAFMAAAEAVAGRGAALHMALPYEGVPAEGADLEDPFLANGASEVPPPVAGARAKVTAAAEQLVGQLAGPQGPTLAGNGGREWWAALARVAFVPASLGLPGSRRARQVLTRYSDAAAASDWPLVWSVLPVVAAERQVPAAVGQGQLRVRSPPPLAAVVAHLKRVGLDGGEEALSAWPASAGSVEDAFRAVLSYLDREGVSGQKAAQLRDVAFVPVARGTLLAPPRRLYVRLKEDFAPFAFEVPPSLASFTALLKSLGAQDEPRAQDLVESLRSLAASVGPTKPLSPNQRAAVLRLLIHVAALGGAGGSVGAGPGGGGGGGAGPGGVSLVGGSAADLTFLATVRRERRLLVLAADGRLVPAHTAVSVGEGGGGGGAAGRLLGRLDPGALTLAHPALPEGVTRWLGCPRLADVAEERLDPGHPLEPVEQIQGLTLRDARALLSSPAFISACHSLLRSHAPLVRGLTTPTHGSLHEVAAALRAAAPRLTFVRSLRTTAVLRSTGAALSPAAEASRVAFDFVESAAAAAAAPAAATAAAAAPPPPPSQPGSGFGSGRIFIAEPPPHLPISWLLSSVVSRVLGSPVVLPLQPLFTTPPGELAALQPVLLPGGFDAGLETAAQAGTPGAPLLPADAALLQLKPLRRYCAGELVAYQRAAAAAAAAAAVPAAVAAAAAAAAAERRLHAGGGVAAAPEAPPGGGMCYGRVAAHCAGPSESAAGGGGGGGGGVHRVLVEVEPGVVQHLMSTQVFCFRSAFADAAPRDDATAPSAAAAAAPSDPLAAKAAAAAADGGGDGAAASSSRSPGGAAPAAAAAAGADLGPVSAREMLAAVRDVMAAAGLPMDPAAGQLMGRVATLQEKLTEVQEQLAQAKREAASSASEAENARGAWQCKICFSRDVDSAYTGCGHTICARCASATASNRCPVCRKPSQSLLRLYRA
ncbi:hypothetical protein PLESTB_001557000 [Pleodorina starrii]|uniref:RING-type domain-containing protein n=1 Tax=Pleodorina starrii TaxID=330485 RepID=A0A9W6BXC6_9CHLO|nr:hypothetical protein PLESTB_001557000 [Pleodorina starrii]GLC72824.1 hypothetical protein PLESTF_001297100 [Pleodorina starrii]